MLLRPLSLLKEFYLPNNVSFLGKTRTGGADEEHGARTQSRIKAGKCYLMHQVRLRPLRYYLMWIDFNINLFLSD